MDGTNLTPEREKLNALRQILPEAFSEGEIDWEKLKAAIGEDINFANERYVLNWAGKSTAFKILQTPTTKTLVACPEDSLKANGSYYQKGENFFSTSTGLQKVGEETSSNTFIEGENLEVLKVLQKSYFGKVKMIYIDPPYNTGNDSFIYLDKFSESKTAYEKRVGDKNENGYLTKSTQKHSFFEGRAEWSKNSKENGQYHSNWLNMMMPRLYLAKNLLRQDGVIFVSIDDNEVHNLRLLMNEVFGEENFRNIFAVRRYDKNLNRQFIEQGLKTFNIGFEYILCYSKSADFSFNPVFKQSSEERQNTGYWKGFWNDANRPTMRYDILGFKPETGQWKWKQETAIEAVQNYEGYIKEHSKNKTLEKYWEETGKKLKFIRRNLDGNGKNKGVENWIAPSDGTLRNTNWTDLFASKHETETQNLFDFPKNKEVISLLTKSCCDENDIILDFFAGSGTTAHAILDLNKEDGGNRKYICVQLPELCDEKSTVFKAGFKTIAEISKERIRKVGKKIQEEIKAEIKKSESKIQKLQSQLISGDTETEIEDLQIKIDRLRNQDVGFKVFQLSDSNFKQWQQIDGKNFADRKAGAKTIAEQMKFFVDPVSANATIENMVYELLLKSGKDLNSSILKIDNLFIINQNELVLMIEKATQEIIDKVVSIKPDKIIALDNLFRNNDQLKTNAVLQMKDENIEFKSI